LIEFLIDIRAMLLIYRLDSLINNIIWVNAIEEIVIICYVNPVVPRNVFPSGVVGLSQSGCLLGTGENLPLQDRHPGDSQTHEEKAKEYATTSAALIFD
jgi:hypothetical protein